MINHIPPSLRAALNTLFYNSINATTRSNKFGHRGEKMNTDVPYMGTSKNVSAILAKIQTASCPIAFTIDFLKDLGFTSSNDRGIVKVLKYIGFLDQNSKPLEPYRKFLDHTISKQILADQLRVAYDDLFNAHNNADKLPASDLKGWFRTKTGQSDAVSEKIATTFRTIADNADFSGKQNPKKTENSSPKIEVGLPEKVDKKETEHADLSLVYRFEIHLPDTQNIDTYRAIFRAIKEELLK
jgi:hypothetical protein